jgi:hypothetical protein
MNFYLNAVDEQLRLGDDRESVGIILCADRDETVAKRAAPRLRADRRLDLEGGFTAAGAPSRRDHRRGASGPRRPIRTRHRPNPIDRASRPPHPGVLTAAKRRESIARSRGLSDERASEFGWDRSPINRDGAAREGWDQRGRGGSARHGASYEGSPTSKHPMRTFGEKGGARDTWAETRFHGYHERRAVACCERGWIAIDATRFASKRQRRCAWARSASRCR